MLWRVSDLETHANLRIETVYVVGGEISLSIKDKPVVTCAEYRPDEKKGFHSTIVISPRFGQLGPALVQILKVESDVDAVGWSTARNIQNVR